MNIEFRPLLRHAFFSLWQHRLRSVLSTLGIACGVTSFLVMMSFGEGARRENLFQLEQLGMKNIFIRAATLTPEQDQRARSLGSRGLTLSDAKILLNSVKSLREVAALREIRVTAFSSTSKELSPAVFATSANYFELQSLDIGTGRLLVENDISNHRLISVLGFQAANEFGEDGRPGGLIRLGDYLYKVVGVLKPMDLKAEGGAAIRVRDFDHAVFLPLNGDFLSPNETSESVHELVVASASSRDVLPSLPLVKRTLEVAHHGADDYRIVAPQELLNQANRTQDTFSILLGCIGLISLFIGGIGIMNIMLANIAERTHEIGIGRALGATRGFIVLQFLIEALLLTLIGGATGIVLGLSCLGIVSLFATWRFYVSPLTVFLPLFFSALIGLIFGSYPAVKAARMDPAAALRQ